MRFYCEIMGVTKPTTYNLIHTCTHKNTCTYIHTRHAYGRRKWRVLAICSVFIRSKYHCKLLVFVFAKISVILKAFHLLFVQRILINLINCSYIEMFHRRFQIYRLKSSIFPKKWYVIVLIEEIENIDKYWIVIVTILQKKKTTGHNEKLSYHHYFCWEKK